MYAEYFYWQFVWAPRWLLEFSWNIQRMLFRVFSVPIMLRTLVAHWHKDAVPYKGGTLSSYVFAFAWNQISRGIGFLVRGTMLILWLIIAAGAAIAAAILFVSFLAWPLVIVVGLSGGITLLFS